MRNRYLFIKHYYSPAAGEKSEMKDFKNKGRKNVDERINFHHRISNKLLVESTYIIDLEEKTVVKNRYRDYSEDNRTTDEDVLNHYLKEYDAEIKSALPGFTIAGNA